MAECENVIKKEILYYTEQAKRNLEKALNVVECNDDFNNSQSQKINELYNQIAKIYDDFETIQINCS